MDRYQAKSKFIQYQLWQECRNGCKFCSERCQKIVDKEWTLNFVLNKLDDPEVYDYEEVGIIGGEIFDNQLENKTVRNKFYQLTKKIAEMPHFKKIYIATSLIYDMNTYLIPYLEYLRELNVMNKVLLCTSYDVKYRFNTKDKEKLWEDNMLYLQKYYPDCKLHVETIVTQHFINAVLEGEFDIRKFCEKFNTRIDYIEPSSGMYYKDKKECEKACPGFFPTKDSFIKFLIVEGLQKHNIDLSCMISYQVRASRIYHLDCGDFVCYKDRRKPGFRVQCKDTTRKYELGFIDSDDTMEDVAMIICEMNDE